MSRGYAARRMVAADAPAIRELVLRVHGSRYPRGELAIPEALVQHHETGAWVCAVGTEPAGSVVGFLALERWEHGPTAELSMGMVLPEHRRAGVTEMLRDFLLGEARSLGLTGYFVEAGTVDAGAQAIADRGGIVPCGLSLGLWPAPEEQGSRRSFVRYFRYLVPPERAVLFVPPRHRGVVARIQEKLGREVVFPDLTGATAREVVFPDLTGATRRDPELRAQASAGGSEREGDAPALLDVRADAGWQSLFLTVRRQGTDLEAELAEATRVFDESASLQAAYLDMPLSERGAAETWEAAERLGFFFGSVTPACFGHGDGLRLQRIKGDPGADRLVITNPFARELLNHLLTERDRVTRNVTPSR